MNALCVNRIDWSLKITYIGYTVMFVALNMVPAALWAGAITPAMVYRSNVDSLPIPEYSNTYGMFEGEWNNSTYSKTGVPGMFTFFPQRDFPGFILSNARQAISPHGRVSSHAKLDKTGYVYETRSFGVGSPVGLTDSFATLALAYQYHEVGLKVSTDCIYNASSRLSLHKINISPELGLSFQIYNLEGYLPNGAHVISAATAMGDSVAFGMGAGSADKGSTREHYVAMTARPDKSGNISTSQYVFLHQAQCQIFFDPYDFLVSVNTTSKSIAVVPQNVAPPFTSNKVIESIVSRLGELAVVVAMSFWVSVLGDAFNANIAVANMNGSSNATRLRGISTSVESMMDDILQAISAAQVMVLNETQMATAEVQSMSFVLGSTRYTYAVLGANIFVTLVFAVELFRTRMWRRAPRFDFVDIKAVILNASAPDNALTAETQFSSSAPDASTSGSTTSAETKVFLINSLRGTRLSLEKAPSNPSTGNKTSAGRFSATQRHPGTGDWSCEATQAQESHELLERTEYRLGSRDPHPSLWE